MWRRRGWVICCSFEYQTWGGVANARKCWRNVLPGSMGAFLLDHPRWFPWMGSEV